MQNPISRWFYQRRQLLLVSEQLATLQSRLIALQNENDRLKEENVRFLNEALKASQAVANWMAQGIGRRNVYDGVGPSLPLPTLDTKPFEPPAPRNGRTAVMRDREAFLTELASKLGQPGDAAPAASSTDPSPEG
jgi:hypothetical protein